VTGLISGIQGTNKDLPFLVAGGTYNDALSGTAKAIIRHDGSVKFTDGEFHGTVYATDGEFTGTIHAANGTIGNWSLDYGRIGSVVLVEDNEYVPAADGMSLYDSFIKFSDGDDVRVFVGSNVLPASSAIRALARFENNEKQGYYENRTRTDVYYSQEEWENAGSPEPAEFFYDGEGILLYIEVTVTYQEWVTMPGSIGYGVIINTEGAEENVAIDVTKGKIKSMYGGVLSWNTDYMGQAYTDTLELHIGKTNHFLFTYIDASLLNVRLPASSFINEYTSGSVSFLLTITIGHNTPNAIRLLSVTNGQLRNNNGDAMSYIDMAKGDTIVLQYYSGNYYIISYRN